MLPALERRKTLIPEGVRKTRLLGAVLCYERHENEILRKSTFGELGMVHGTERQNGCKTKDAVGPIDREIGMLLRRYRLMRQLSQGELGRMVGLSFQQVQKYEKGANKMSASRLVDLAEALSVPVTRMFPERADNGAACSNASRNLADDPLLRRESHRLIANFEAIGDLKLREAVLQTVRSMAKQQRRLNDGDRACGRGSSAFVKET